MYVYIKQHENNKNQSKREREKCSYVSNCLAEFVIPWQNGGLGNEVLDSFKY